MSETSTVHSIGTGEHKAIPSFVGNFPPVGGLYCEHDGKQWPCPYVQLVILELTELADYAHKCELASQMWESDRAKLGYMSQQLEARLQELATGIPGDKDAKKVVISDG